MFELRELPFVHMVKDVKLKEGLRYVLVRCDALLAGEKSIDRQIEWSVWESEVTCPDCFVWGPPQDC